MTTLTKEKPLNECGAEDRGRSISIHVGGRFRIFLEGPTREDSVIFSLTFNQFYNLLRNAKKARDLYGEPDL